MLSLNNAEFYNGAIENLCSICQITMQQKKEKTGERKGRRERKEEKKTKFIVPIKPTIVFWCVFSHK